MPKKELYQLARAFHKTRLWDQLYDSQLYAVQMPDGALGYVCVMGMRGDHLALAVYPGSAGLNAYRMLYGSLEGTREIVRREIMMSQDCVMCSFENKDELSERERAEIRDLGLRFQGKQSYPMFKRYKPRRFPWFVEDPRDEEYLRLGLLAGLDVARRVEGRAVQQDLFHAPDSGVSKEALGFSQGPPFDREIPLLTPKEDGTFAWGMTPLPAPSKPVYASPRLEDEMVLTKLKKLKQVGAWECGVFMHPEPTAEGDTDEDGFVTEPTCAPDFPLVLLMVERADGLVVHMGMTKQPEADLGELLDAFVEGMMKNGRPEEIFVEDERTFALLEGIAEQLGLRITLLEDLPLLEEAEDELLRSIDEDEDSVEMLDSFLDEAQGIELPEAMRTMLENMLDRGALPDSVAEKARRLLEGKPSLPGTAPQALPVARKRAASVKGSYLFSVSLAKGCYRHIQISAAATLFDLHAAILDAFEFDDDHLHAFFMDNKVWSQAESYYSEYDDQADRHTSNYTLGEIGLSVGKHFKYLFDYGDEWRFQCKVLRVMREEVEEAEVVRSVGDAPEQYPALEEDDEDAEEPTFPELYSKDKIACLYAGLALPKETVEQLSAYFDAFANLYGVIPLREALKIFNRQNQPIQEADFEAFAEVARHEDRVFSILGEDDLYSDGNLASPMDREIIHEYLLFGDTEELEDLKSVQADKPYYVPSRRTLLRYADDHYFERTPEYTALRNYLRKETGLSAGKADAIAEELRLDAHMGERDMELILRELGRLGVKLENIGEVIPIVSLFYEMANHTRMHAHRGHTTKELFGENDTAPVVTWGPGVVEAVRRGDLIPEAMRAQAQRMEFPSDEFRNNYLSELDRIEREARAGAPRAIAPKIGRNAPCPCGSGQKYKHCCGKDV